jgi:hypothetical protein
MASKRGRNGFHKEGKECGKEVEVWSGDFVLFWKPSSVFSQWTMSSFEVDGAPYRSFVFAVCLFPHSTTYTLSLSLSLTHLLDPLVVAITMGDDKTSERTVVFQKNEIKHKLETPMRSCYVFWGDAYTQWKHGAMKIKKKAVALFFPRRFAT